MPLPTHLEEVILSRVRVLNCPVVFACSPVQEGRVLAAPGPGEIRLGLRSWLRSKASPFHARRESIACSRSWKRGQKGLLG